MPLPKDHLFFGFELTDEQREYVNSIINDMVTVVIAPAGTGKTQLAVATAKLLQRELVYIISPVEEKEMGYRPGTQFEKEMQYMGALYDALDAIGEDPTKCIVNEEALKDGKARNEVMRNIKTGKAWVYAMTPTFLRGRNLSGNKLIFIDEAQNWTKQQLKKTLTRIHDSCKVVIAGHNGQCDLPDIKMSGFNAYIDFYGSDVCTYAKVVALTKCFRGVIANDADKV